MSKINLFLQKMKIREKHHGAILIVAAYALSFLMLLLGSDTFHNITSSAAGAKPETKELQETQDLLNEGDPGKAGENQSILGTALASEVHNTLEIQENEGDLLTTPALQRELQVLTANLMNPYGLGEMDTLTLSAGTANKAEGKNTLATQAANANKDKTAADNGKAEASKDGTKKAKEKSREEEQTTESLSVSEADSLYVVNITKEEVDMLERIVEAEASGEDMVGKILVADVIINRTADDEFPDTVKKVIFQKTDGGYQFTPIEDERFWEVTVSKSTRKAVKRALGGEDYSKGALYFMSRKQAKSSNIKWFDNHLKWLFKHGGHEFYK